PAPARTTQARAAWRSSDRPYGLRGAGPNRRRPAPRPPPGPAARRRATRRAGRPTAARAPSASAPGGSARSQRQADGVPGGAERDLVNETAQHEQATPVLPLESARECRIGHGAGVEALAGVGDVNVHDV